VVSGAKVAGSDPETLGGLIGGVFEDDKFTLDVTKSFWDTETTGQATSAGGEGKTTVQMKEASTFAGWDISSVGGEDKVWRIYEGHTAPLLRSFLTPLTLAGTPTVDKESRVYDATTDVTVDSSVLTWSQDGQAVTPNDDWVFESGYRLDGKNVGQREVIGGFYSSQLGYDIIDQTSKVTVEITKADLKLTGLTAQDKVYDATLVATLGGEAGVAALLDDQVSLSGTATGAFDDKHVAQNKVVNISGLSLSGEDAGNYTLVLPSNLTANISAKPITISGISAQDRVYNRDVDALVDVTKASGWITGDQVTVSATGVFDNKSVGENKTVTLTSQYKGADASNYIITDQATTSASITPKAITISGITAADREYDGGVSADVDATNASGWIAGDDLTVSAIGTFDNKNVGVDKEVTINSKYSGEDVGNYSIVDQTTTTANITAKELVIKGLTAENRTYDGSRVATIVINGVEYAGLVKDDDVSISATGEFDDKNVGVDKEVTITSKYSGADVGNYKIVDQTETSANITAKELVIKGLTAENRTYDGSRVATIVINGVEYAGLVENDEVNISATGEFDDKNVGENKTVTITSDYSGADVDNYSIVDQTTTTANITAKQLVIKGLTAENRIYDGGRVATIVIDGVEYAGLVENDEVNISATGEFDDKNVGVDKEVTITSIYSGADLGNYKITNQTSTTATITAKELIISGLAAEGKVYDGSKVATILINGVEFAGLIGKDDVKVSATGEFADKNVGENKTVSITSEYSGADINNYSIVDQTSTTANITAKELLIKGLTAENRTYDGSRVATIVINGVEYAGLVKDDDVKISASGEFDDKNVGVDKEVTITSTYSGADVGNYTIQNQTTTTANITAKELVIKGLTAENRTYDGSRVATIVIDGVEYAGLVGNDEVNISATGEFADKNVGENKTVTITSEYSGADLGNYKITNQATTTATITAKDLIISGLTAEGKVYDGNRIATIVIDGVQYAGLVENDEINISATGEFADKNVGENKTVSITSEYSGADVNNYNIQNQATTTASITAKDLIIRGLTAEGKVYDGNRIATIVIDGVQYAGLVENDEVNISASGEFDNKNVGENKTVTITSDYSGADVNNYTIQNQATTMASITPKGLTISGMSAEDKFYDGNTRATLLGGDLVGVVAGERLSFTGQSGQFASLVIGPHDVSVSGLSLVALENADINNYTVSIPEYIRATINPQAGTDTGAQQRDTVVNVPAAQTPVLTPAPSLVSDTRAADVVADAVPAPVAAEPAAVETFAVEALDVEAQDVETLAAEPIALEPVAAEPVEVETVEVETVEAETVEVETVEVETVEVETVEAETVAAEPVAVIDQPAVRSSSVSINGETVALNFSQTAEVATLEVGDASMATDEVIQPGLAIYESSGGTTRLDSVVDISDRGNSVSATAGSADTAQASIEMSSPVVEQTSISLTNEEGVEETMDVSMLEDGTLVIDLPANASVSDSRQATLMGVAAAKRAGVSVDRLKAVVINRR
jgi:IMP cyclohydrolase